MKTRRRPHAPPFAKSIGPLLLAAFLAPSLAADEYWVTDRAGDRVVAFDANTGAFLRTVSSSMMSQPLALTTASDGFLYVANGSLGDPQNPVPPIVKIDPATGTATEFDVGAATSEEAPLLPGGILFANDSLYVSEFGQFNGNRVFRFGLTGGDPLETLGLASPPTGRTGLAIHNGQLYISEFGNPNYPDPLAGLPVGSVLRDDGASGYTTFASGVGLSETVLLGANGLDFDSSGDLYVASLIGQGIVRYDIEAGVAGSPSAFGGPIAYPSGILLTADGGRESLLATGLGNNNPADPIYGSFLFPGNIHRVYLDTQAPVSFLVGDFSGDLVVNEADLAILVDNIGTLNGAEADADGDGDADGHDFLAWQRGVGNQGLSGAFQPTAIIRVSAPAAAHPVPEPSAAAIALVLAGGIMPRLTRRPVS